MVFGFQKLHLIFSASGRVHHCDTSAHTIYYWLVTSAGKPGHVPGHGSPSPQPPLPDDKRGAADPARFFLEFITSWFVMEDNFHGAIAAGLGEVQHDLQELLPLGECSGHAPKSPPSRRQVLAACLLCKPCREPGQRPSYFMLDCSLDFCASIIALPSRLLEIDLFLFPQLVRLNHIESLSTQQRLKFFLFSILDIDTACWEQSSM